MKNLIFLFIICWISVLHISAQKYFLKETEAEASCTSFIIVDENQKEVEVVTEVKTVLDCPSVLDLHGNILITYLHNQLVWYNIASKQLATLVELYSDIDGVSGVQWSPDGESLMFVVINQEKKYGYKEFCRIIVLRVDGSGKVTSKQKFDQPVHFSCGSTCSSDPGSDFRFKDNRTIQYRRHELIEDRPGEWETIYLK